MAIQKITDEQFIAEREAGKTLRQIAQEYGMNIRTVEQRSSRLAKRGEFHLTVRDGRRARFDDDVERQTNSLAAHDAALPPMERAGSVSTIMAADGKK